MEGEKKKDLKYRVVRHGYRLCARRIINYRAENRIINYRAEEIPDTRKDKCLYYCSIFPKDYEIDSDTLVQLWMAAGFITNEPSKGCSSGHEYLKTMEHKKLICISRKDPTSGKVWYKIGDLDVPQYIQLLLGHVNLDSQPFRARSAYRERPAYIVTVRDTLTDLEVIQSLEEMKALLFLRGHGSYFKHIPPDLFFSLKQLETLDLSGTQLLELPSSIGNVKCLRYLDLSETLIKQLPETLDRLQHLQTLKLLKCKHLNTLPKGMRKLTKLLHLEFDSPSRLHALPPGIGALTSLRTLTEFPVGLRLGCHVLELKRLNELRGALCISQLENVVASFLDEVKEAKLSHKQWLLKLELKWSTSKTRKHQNIRFEDEVIEYLRPHTNLKYLKIRCYGGSKFPAWISDPSFVNLVSITLFGCENCEVLPFLGQLPSLEFLSLRELSTIKTIDFHPSQDGVVAFPRLQKLEIVSMHQLVEITGPKECDFFVLVEFTVKDCPELVALMLSGVLPSLKVLELNACPRLPSLPGGDFFIGTLLVDDCPLLASSCSKDGTQDWLKIRAIPSVFLDGIEKHHLLESDD